MKIKTILISIVGLSTISLFSFTKESENFKKYNHSDAKNSAGANVGYTGAPGDLGNCTNCHGGTIALTNSSVAFISFSGTNNKYIADSTYTVNVELVGAPSPTNGFEIVALKNTDDSNIGTFTITDAINTKLRNGNSRSYVTHTSDGNSITSWNFNWTAPSNGVGDITFYLASNVSNDNGFSSGDEIHLKELVIQEDITNSISEDNNIDNNLILLNNNNIITTKLTANESNDVLTSVLSLSGQIIYSNYGIVFKGENTLETIDFNQFPKGIYIIKYKIGNELITRKVLI